MNAIKNYRSSNLYLTIYDNNTYTLRVGRFTGTGAINDDIDIDDIPSYRHSWIKAKLKNFPDHKLVKQGRYSSSVI